MLGACAAGVLAFIALMTVTVFIKAWPSFSHNSFYKWFLPGGDVDTQMHAIITESTRVGHYTYHFRAWPILWGTIVTTVLAVLIAMPFSIFAAIFIVEFAPGPMRRILDPVVRLLAGVPSVVYGLIGILVLAPWIEQTFISQQRKESVAGIVQLTGACLSLAAVILAVMITPIMIAIIVNALAAVPRSWTEGSAALGVNRWRTIWRISLRTARPAIVASGVLGVGRALGEAIMLALVAGSRGFAPNLLDGTTALFEPVRPLAATILHYYEDLSNPPVAATLYAMGAVLLVSTALLSLAGWAAKQPMKRYGIRA